TSLPARANSTNSANGVWSVATSIVLVMVSPPLSRLYHESSFPVERLAIQNLTFRESPVSLRCIRVSPGVGFLEFGEGELVEAGGDGFAEELPIGEIEQGRPV